jgi:hypothetical protein
MAVAAEGPARKIRLVVAESDAHLLPDGIRFFTREREEGFDALARRASCRLRAWPRVFET